MFKKLLSLFIPTFFILSLMGCQPEPQATPKHAESVKSLQNQALWSESGGGPAQRYYSPLDFIDKSNVSQLGFAWQYDIDTKHGFEATPILIGHSLYTTGPMGAVYAIDATSGKEHWTFNPPVDPSVMRKVCCGLINRGLAASANLIYVGAIDGILYALNQQDGKVVWSVDTIIDHERGYTVTGAPYVANNVVVIGNSGAELDARGYVSAYDLVSGDLVWRFYTVPGNPNAGFEHPELAMAAKTWDPNSLWEVGLGGTVWDGMAYDPKANLLYIGTGNAAPYPRKLRSPTGGDNLFLASILAINPDSGRLVWHYQTTPADNWDFTATQKIILADIDIEGQSRKVLMQAPKNGFFYVIDRISGELISAEPYVPVNWASHIDPQTGRPVETGQGEYFNETKLVFPGPQGGHNWQPMAFNPLTGLVYIPVMEAGAIWYMPDTLFTYNKGGNNTASVYLWPMPGSMGLDDERAQGLPDLAELSKGQPDTTIRGFLRAWDPIKQQTAWEVETSGQWQGHLFATWNGGGAMTTAGGLVFQGRSTGELVVLDATSGSELHRIDVGTSMMAAPMSYSINGEQYIAIMAGLGGALGQSHPPGTAAYDYGNQGRIVAFKLGGKTVPKPKKLVRQSSSYPKPQVKRRGTASQLTKGHELFARHCVKCHTNTDGPGIPNLKRMTLDTHNSFNDIVLKGTREQRGMGSFSSLLNSSDVEALHSYLIDLAWKEHESTLEKPKYHQGISTDAP